MVTEIQLYLVGIIIILLIVYFKIKLRYLQRKEIRVNNQIVRLKNNLFRERGTSIFLASSRREDRKTPLLNAIIEEYVSEAHINEEEEKINISGEEKTINKITGKIYSKEKELKQTKQKISQLQKYILKSSLGPFNQFFSSLSHFLSSLAPKDSVALIVAVIALIIAILKFIRP